MRAGPEGQPPARVSDKRGDIVARAPKGEFGACRQANKHARKRKNGREERRLDAYAATGPVGEGPVSSRKGPRRSTSRDVANVAMSRIGRSTTRRSTDLERCGIRSIEVDPESTRGAGSGQGKIPCKWSRARRRRPVGPRRRLLKASSTQRGPGPRAGDTRRRTAYLRPTHPG